MVLVIEACNISQINRSVSFEIFYETTVIETLQGFGYWQAQQLVAEETLE